ncbi:hypothetical protein [Dryocola sp. BD626]|uniref:hypothetical protein n=1 Tax=Dryocola sp. BD626 TaxID=3133273 RepID=UPI003F4F4102
MTAPPFGGEDFSSYQEHVPEAFLLVGSRNEEKGGEWNVHNPHFLLDEDTLLAGVKMH